MPRHPSSRPTSGTPATAAPSRRRRSGDKPDRPNKPDRRRQRRDQPRLILSHSPVARKLAILGRIADDEPEARIARLTEDLRVSRRVLDLMRSAALDLLDDLGDTLPPEMPSLADLRHALLLTTPIGDLPEMSAGDLPGETETSFWCECGIEYERSQGVACAVCGRLQCDLCRILTYPDGRCYCWTHAPSVALAAHKAILRDWFTAGPGAGQPMPTMPAGLVVAHVG